MPASVPTKESACIAPEAEILEVLERDEEETRELFTTVCGYRIGRLVARGGMSVVFEVTHPPRQDVLAMKVVIDSRLQSELAAAAFYKHAVAVAAIDSQHIVRTVDAGRLPSGEPFIVMERLDGEDLAARLAREGALPVEEAVRLTIEACEGLAAAHDAGIVHGDIKPGNLVLAKTALGKTLLKIVDFGPAVPRASDPDDPLITCSPGYAAPEQLGTRRDVDGRADVFALGAVLYELLTGKRAFEATTLTEMIKVTGNVPPSMKRARPEISAGLETLVLRCIARDREARFASVAELRAALAALGLVRPEAAITAKRRGAHVVTLPTMDAARSRRRAARVLLLGSLFPVSAILSMTIVRLVLASSLFAPPTPPQAGLVPEGWPPPAQLSR